MLAKIVVTICLYLADDVSCHEQGFSDERLVGTGESLNVDAADK